MSETRGISERTSCSLYGDVPGNFILLIACITDNILMTPNKETNKQNAHTCSLDIYIIISPLMFLHVSVRKGPSSGNQNKVVQYKTKLVNFVLC